MGAMPDKKKSRGADKNVVYMTVMEDTDPIPVRVRRIIPEIVDEYVRSYKKPIPRADLFLYTFTQDRVLINFLKERPESAKAIFSVALSRLVKEGKIIRVKDPNKKKRTYYVSPKHLDLLRKSS